jgi:hypothetical protein
MITIQFNEDEAETVLSQSATFRYMMFRALKAAQAENAKLVKPTEIQLLQKLNNYVRSNFSSPTKIAGIKYVRQFVSDNMTYLTLETYNRLYSLSGAKQYVENLIGW